MKVSWPVSRSRLSALLRLRRNATGSPASHAASLMSHDHSWRHLDGLKFVSRSRITGDLGGEHRSRSHAASIDFVDYRSYQPGDDFRRVDWNAYGRLGTLQVKVTESPERLDVLLVVDCSASMRWGDPDKLEYARRLAGALAYISLQGADVVRVVCLGEERQALGPVKGRALLPDVLRFLSGVAPGGCVSLPQQLTDVVPPLPRGARGAQPLVIILSDFLIEDVSALATACDDLINKGADLAMIHVLSQQELAPDPQGDVELVDLESGTIIDAVLTTPVIDLYRERLDRWLAEIESVCNVRGLRYVRAQTNYPVAALLLDDLRRARLLR